MERMLAERMARVSSSPTMRVLVEAEKLRQRGIDVVEFGAGEPDFDHPHTSGRRPPAIDGASRNTRPRRAPLEVREADVPPLRRSCTGLSLQAGGSHCDCGREAGALNVAVALFEEGDEVITHSPGLADDPGTDRAAGAPPVMVRTLSRAALSCIDGRPTFST